MEGKSSLDLESKLYMTLEEEIYWKHFKSLHFSLTLTSDFHNHLKLPEKFAAHMEAELPSKVSLKSPSGAIWDIDLQNKTGDLCFVGNEWKAFVRANGLKENCLLVFKYNRNAGFEVLIFDQEGSCERESAYFVKKCVHAESGWDDKIKRIIREEVPSNGVVEEEDGDEDDTLVASKKARKDDGVVVDTGEKLRTQTPKKQVLAAAKHRGGPRRVVPSDNSKIQSSEKSISNESSKEVSENPQIDNTITPEPAPADHSHELESQSSSIGCQSLCKHVVPEKQPSGNETASEPRKISEIFQAIDHFHRLKALSEKEPSIKDTPKEPCQSENSRSSDSDIEIIAEKAPTGCGKAKRSCRFSRRAVDRPNYTEGSSDDDSCNSYGERSGSKKLVTAKSSESLISKSALNMKRYSKEYVSNRRPVTETEITNAWGRASQAQTEDSYIAKMRSSNVYSKFYLYFPAEWAQKHCLQNQQKVVLRVGKKTWRTTFHMYAKFSGLTAGWKSFALENYLEKFDVLLFKPVNQQKDNDEAAVMMDVDIFRVAPSIIPPMLNTSDCY